MSTRLTNEEYLTYVRDNEDDIVQGLSSVDLKLFIQNLCQRANIAYSIFNPLEIENMNKQAFIRYVLRVFCEHLKSEVSTWDSFVQVVSSLEGCSIQLVEKLRSINIKKYEVMTNQDFMEGDSMQNITFKIEDANLLAELLVAASPKWENIAVSLGLKKYERENCKTDDIKLCLYNVIACWLTNHSNTTLTRLQESLASSVVGERNLSLQIEEKFKQAKLSQEDSLTSPSQHISVSATSLMNPVITGKSNTTNQDFMEGDSMQNITFKIEDANLLAELLVAASPKWENIAVSLGLKKYERENCKTDDIKLCLYNVIACWLTNHSNTTLTRLQESLASSVVGERNLSLQIEEKFKQAKLSQEDSLTSPSQHISVSATSLMNPVITGKSNTTNQDFMEGDSMQNITFKIEDANLLAELLVAASPKWENIAVSLGLKKYERENCKTDNIILCLYNVIACWLTNHSNTTLTRLQESLASSVVGERILSLKLNKAKFSQEDLLGKSALLLVEANPKNFESYQLMKNETAIEDSSHYTGVHSDMLVISKACRGREGEYTCCVTYQEKEVCNEKITVKTLVFTREEKAFRCILE